MSKAKVMTGAERKASILEAGAKLASKHGAVNVTRRMVAKAAKVSEALVSSYMGGTEQAQRAYARKAKALKLPLPDKATAERLGAKLRAHGPRDKRDTRKRSAKEVKAIKDKVVKVAAKPLASVKVRGNTVTVSTRRSGVDARSPAVQAEVKAKVRAAREVKPSLPAAKRERKPAAPKVKPQPAPEVAPLPAPPETKTAAREPKAPPVNLVNLL
jgi:hypothetical protein